MHMGKGHCLCVVGAPQLALKLETAQADSAHQRERAPFVSRIALLFAKHTTVPACGAPTSQCGWRLPHMYAKVHKQFPFSCVATSD